MQRPRIAFSVAVTLLEGRLTLDTEPYLAWYAMLVALLELLLGLCCPVD